MELIELNGLNVNDGIKEIIISQKECIVYGIPDKNYVFCGYSNILNKQFCVENDITLLDFPNEGGVIVVSEGDFDIGHFSKKTDNTFNDDFAKTLETYLKEKNIDARFMGNDLIVDGKYKCGSFSSRRFGEIIYNAFHVSINCDLEMIKNICLKPMVKIPKGLKEYGISTQQIKSLFLSFVHTYNK